MRRFLGTNGLVLFLGWWIVGGLFAQEPRTFRVATWNLEWFYDEATGDNYSDLAKQQSAPSRADWDWKRDAVAAAIAALDVNVAAFQEIENGRVLWYLSRALERNHQQKFRVAFIEGTDTFTEQDVGLLVRNVDLARSSRHEQTQQMFRSGKYHNVTKHLEARIVVDPDAANEPVLLFNLHFRARGEEEELRKRQAQLVRAWIGESIAQGISVIVLGDTNSEHVAGDVPPDSDLGILCGLDNADARDDLVDLLGHAGPITTATHLLGRQQYDRILVSRSLMEDDPARPDLVFKEIQVRPELAIRGQGADVPQEHWEKYWGMAAEQRDISDHYPIVATFEIR